MVANDLRKRRLDGIEIEPTVLAVVKVGSHRADRHIVLKIETREDVCLPFRRNSRKPEICRRRLVNLIARKAKPVPTTAQVKDQIRPKHARVVGMYSIVLTVFESAENRVGL